MKIYQIAMTLIIVVAGNGFLAHADDCGCTPPCGWSSCSDSGSGGCMLQLSNILERLAQPSCATCTACDLGGGCDGGCAGQDDAGPGGDSGCGGCLGDISPGLQRLKIGMQNLMQGSMRDPCGGLVSSWYNGSRPPKRMGGGPFRKCGPCWYTAPTEWTLFGVIPLSHHSTCLCSKCAGGTSSRCGADSGCAVYPGDHAAPAISHHAAAWSSRSLATSQTSLVSAIEERGNDNAKKAKRKQPPQLLKKSISFRREDVTRNTGTGVVSTVAAQLKEPSRLKTNPELFLETDSEAALLRPARPIEPLGTSEMITRPNRSSFGKASLKIVK